MNFIGLSCYKYIRNMEIIHRKSFSVVLLNKRYFVTCRLIASIPQQNWIIISVSLSVFLSLSVFSFSFDLRLRQFQFLYLSVCLYVSLSISSSASLPVSVSVSVDRMLGWAPNRLPYAQCFSDTCFARFFLGFNLLLYVNMFFNKRIYHIYLSGPRCCLFLLL